MGRDIYHSMRLLRAPSILAWNVSRDGTSATSLGNLGQGFTILMVKNSFLLSSLSLPFSSLKPLPLVPSPPALVPAPLQLSRSPSRHWQLLWGLPAAFSSPGWAAPALPAFPPSRGVPALASLLGPPLDPKFLVWELRSRELHSQVKHKVTGNSSIWTAVVSVPTGQREPSSSGGQRASVPYESRPGKNPQPRGAEFLQHNTPGWRKQLQRANQNDKCKWEQHVFWSF